MATTSPDNIWTQDSTDNYDLVVDAAATAASIQAALVARANSYTGTTAQRTAFTSRAVYCGFFMIMAGNAMFFWKGMKRGGSV